MIKITGTLILLFFVSLPSFAAKILQAKNGKVLLSLDGDKVSVGQSISLKGADGKVVATAEIAQEKNGRAIAVVKTGNVTGSETVDLGGSATAGGMTLDDEPTAATPEKPSGAEPDEEKISPNSYAKQTKNVYRLNSTKMAVLITAGMNSMVTKQADAALRTEDVALKGTSIGLAASIDFPFNNWLILRGTAGLEPFTAAGTSTLVACDDRKSKDCNANMNYLAAGGWARLNFTKSRFQLWGALGGSGKFPATKSSTALKTDDIKMTVTFGGALGFDFFISNKGFIPVSTEFQLFQSSDTVTANTILFRTGYGWAF